VQNLLHKCLFLVCAFTLSDCAGVYYDKVGSQTYFGTTSVFASSRYNVSYDVGQGSRNNQLADGKVVVARFSISREASVAPLDNNEVDPRLLALVKGLRGGEFIPLDVTMICHVCKDMSPVTRTLDLGADGTSSKPIQFTFVPDAAGASQKSGSITFSVVRNGTEFDFINAPVVVLKPGQVAADNTPEPCLEGDMIGDDLPYDLIVHVSYSADGRLVASFLPHAKNVQAALNPLVLDPSGHPRTFVLGASPQELAGQLSTSFVDLKALIDQTPNRYGVPDVPALTDDAKFALTQAQERDVTELLYEIGVDLYDDLFLRNGGQINDIVSSLEEIQSDPQHPLHILFYTNQVYVPWQILHAPGGNIHNRDTNGFWGLKYVITSVPEDGNRACGAMATDIPMPTTQNTIYVAFRATAPRQPGDVDVVSSYGVIFGDALKNEFLMGALQQPLTARDFLSVLDGQKQEISSIIFYTHGHSGSSIVQINNQSIVAIDPKGPRLDFSEVDTLSLSNLQAETAVIDRTKPFLLSHPFVLLDGCETGASGLVPGSDNSFPGLFLDRGAAIVLATESPVWDQFGLGFANKIISELSAGKTVGDAVYETRRYYLETVRNPLGLVFTEYGSAYAKFERNIFRTQNCLSQDSHNPKSDDYVQCQAERQAEKILTDAPPH